MREPVVIEIENWSQFRRAIRNSEDSVKKAVREFDKDIADSIASHALEYTPERTGALKRSTKSGVDNRGAWVGAGTSVLVIYAPVIHWGWPSRGIKRSGFLIRGMAATGRDLGDGDFRTYYLNGIIEVVNKTMATT